MSVTYDVDLNMTNIHLRDKPPVAGAVVITFASAVDAATATGAFQVAVPGT